jgi:YD repeat-containing protein
MAVDERELLYILVRGDDDWDAGNGGPTGSSMQVYNYDVNGNVVEFVDGRNYTWPYTYDGLDRRVRTLITPPDSFFDVYYNPDESVRSQAVRTGALFAYHQTDYEYDELGRLVGMNQYILDDTGTLLPEDADGDGIAETHYEYDRNSRRSRVQDDNGRIEDYDNDGAGRMVHKADAIGDTIQYEYDPLNRLISTVEYEATSFGTDVYNTQNNYDWLGRLQDTTDNLGNTRTFEYDSRDNLVQITDALGNVTRYSYDGLDRRIETNRHMTVDGTGSTPVVGHLIHQYRYDLNGRVGRLIDPENNATTYQYDPLNRLIKQDMVDGSTMEYGYDDNDNVVTVKDANGSVIEIVYDDADRPVYRTGLTLAVGVHNITQWFNYDNMNRLVEATEHPPTGPDIEIDLRYDSLNRIREERSQLGGSPLRTFTYSYDGVGNRLSADYPTTGPVNVLSYSYDPLNRLATAQDTQTGYFSNTTYLGPERVAERFHGNGTRKSFLDSSGTAVIGYDGIKQVQHLDNYDASNASQTSFDYGHDAEGNIKYEQRWHDGGRGDVWVYDSAYRVDQFVKGVQDPVAEAAVPGSGGAFELHTDYTLDRVGNWVERTISDMISPPRTFGNQINNLNEYGEKPDDGVNDDFDDDLGTIPPDGINLAHDLNGNLIREDGRRYEYDVFNRLHKVVDAGTDLMWYSYDALNRRAVEKNVTGAVSFGTRFVYDGDHLVTELDVNDLTVEIGMSQRYFYGAEAQPVATYDDPAGALYYLHEDSQGNVRATTDSAGAVIERITYDDNGDPEFRDPANNPWGLNESIAGNRILYLAQAWDPLTRFHQKRGGYFAPRFGRHIQRLMPGQVLGPMGTALNPPMLFPNFLDPIGMNPFWWCRGWFWHPAAWWGGWGAWKPFWWWGGPWGWWNWRPWLWMGAPHGWWILKPWGFWWGGPVDWWGWPAWSARPGWWGWWPWWGWGGWRSWLPVWGWMGWKAWWPIWGWNGWVGWWPAFGWWGWGDWWPSWTLWWGWHPHWWHGWWTWMPWWHWGWWSWAGVGFWWNWWAWVHWWPWSWWNWVGWWPWWGWAGWNPWWYWGWWSWYLMDWTRGIGMWWGPISWWYWSGWWWVPWWWCVWGGAGWWVWWFWPWWVNWWWWGWWSWHWHLWAWPWWGRWRWWGWWWPWWGWWH